MTQQSTENDNAQSPIRVCFIIDNWLLGRGGTEVQLLMLLKHLDPKRIKPFVVLYRGQEKDNRQIPVDVPLLCLEIRSLLSFSIPGKYRQFYRFLKEEKIDLIQTYFPDSTFFGAIAGKLSGVKCVFGARRNIGHWMTPKDKCVAKFLNRFFLDKIVANAEACKKAVIEQENAKPENVIVIPNGIERDRFQSIPTWSRENAHFPRKIGAVGNLKPVKGTDVLIDAAKIVLDKHTDVQFEVAGTGNFDLYNKQIADLGIADRFRLAGSLADIPGFLATLDVAVLPSRAEGLSNGLLEYMAAGRPAIATDVGGNGELIRNGENGLLVPSENPQALADAICDLLDNPQKAERFALAARNDVQSKYDAKFVADRFCDLCEQMLRK